MNVTLEKNTPPHDIIGTNLLRKFHKDQTINVASRVLTSTLKKDAPPTRFSSKWTIFQVVPDIIFQNDRTINVASRVLTSKNCKTKFHEDWTINVASRVFTIRFYYIIWANLLTKFHDGQTINVDSRVLTRKKCPAPWQPCFLTILYQDIIRTNLLNKFYKDWTINKYFHIRKIAPPPGSHIFQPTGTIFEIIQDIIGTNLLTKFHKDWTINVACRVLTRQMLTPHDGQRTKGYHKSLP
ncbi:hypothetical protein DPMN_065992 [Dreissena polymorpha]|uniref:Uncharacterized protein n=1 Tax=Dreissena polymorpha TaxID=45954 RepID=A0A9D3YY56_DREPO|nr:hypothetical protein DPMN_065992 [Dreissena polymorpha]